MSIVIFVVVAAALGYGLYDALQNTSMPDDGMLSISQVSGYASQAGFAGADLVTAIAVALAESSGNPTAYNPETAAGAPDGKGSFGLWQVYLNAHPEFAQLNLNDPQTNANAAYAIYVAANYSFSPWSTYKNGAYMAYVSQAESGVSG